MTDTLFLSRLLVKNLNFFKSTLKYQLFLIFLMEVIINMSNKINENCPCPNTSCPRHGDCEACIAAHKAHGSKTKCGKG